MSSSTGLDTFRGVVFVGGFSYGDVLGSAKGWAAAIQYNENIREQFDSFYNRSDTFSLGVCNGCQLLTWLGMQFSYYIYNLFIFRKSTFTVEPDLVAT